MIPASNQQGAIMTSSVAELESQALQLTPEDRVTLADSLLASISTGHALDDTWSQEAERRLAELENGTVVAVPIETAIARARAAVR